MSCKKVPIILVVCLVVTACITLQAAPFQDRFVFLFGWGLDKESDVAEIEKVLDEAGQHGYNGAVLSA